MRKHLFYLSMVLVLTLFSACGGGKKGVFTPTSSGRAYEVLVVVEPGLWERPAGRALFDVLDSDVPGLPQSERSFRIMYTAPSNYDATLKLIRNIIIVDVNKDLYTQPKIQVCKECICRSSVYSHYSGAGRGFVREICGGEQAGNHRFLYPCGNEPSDFSIEGQA